MLPWPKRRTSSSFWGPPFKGVGIFTFPDQDKDRPETLEPGMVVSVSNIGLFLDRGLGVRIEDMALITEDEPVYLTHFTKELIRI